MMTRWPLFLSLALMLPALLFTQPVKAQDPEEPRHVRMTVTPEISELPAGGSVFVLIKQEIDKDWHTYWKNAGDSGEPPVITWNMPEGFTTAPILWPVPQRINIGPLTNYGYENEVTLIQEIKAPFEIPEGPITLKAKAEILVCHEICIPETHELSITFNNGDKTDNSELVSAAFMKVPVDVDWEATYRENDKGQFEIDMYFEQPGLIADDSDQIKFDVLPYEWGLIDNTAITTLSHYEKKKVLLFKKRGERPLNDIGPTDILIAYEINGTERGGIKVTAAPDPSWLLSHDSGDVSAEPSSTMTEPPQETAQKKNWFQKLFNR